ncbi:choice-of-anchor D domain-containing protein [Candidatus Marithrix sp. Canyon 246]|uniref:choice-of-anchor D domain-containing protein n=1 Tax=Candidatus Marithrix sp. Canyon 246 TaxID=1827136 RepID=UPI00403DF111
MADGDTSPNTSDHTDFGSVNISSGTLAHTFTIENSGLDNLSITNTSITGTNASDFSVTDAPATPVTASESTTFTITFDPSAAGTNIEGGQIQGKINGNPEKPAVLINVKITAKAELSYVILDKTVDLPSSITTFDSRTTNPINRCYHCRWCRNAN